MQSYPHDSSLPSVVWMRLNHNIITKRDLIFDDDRRTEKYTVIIFTGGDQVFCSNTMSEVHYIQGSPMSERTQVYKRTIIIQYTHQLLILNTIVLLIR